MKVKGNKKIILLLVASVSALVLVAATQAPQVRNRFKREFEPGTIPYIAQELKKKGVTDAGVRGGFLDCFPPASYDEALLGADLAVLATALDQRFRLQSNLRDILTDTKFRVDEVLSQKITKVGKREFEVPVAELPSFLKSLGPIGADEIIVVRKGGALIVEGVRFRDVYVDSPPFVTGRQYVLFLKLIPQEALSKQERSGPVNQYLLLGGSAGALLVKEEGPVPTVEPLTKVEPIRRNLELYIGTRKDFFLDRMRRMALGA